MVTADSPEYARAQYVCGEAFLVLGDAKLSEASFRRVLAKNATATPALIELCTAWLSEVELGEPRLILATAGSTLFLVTQSIPAIAPLTVPLPAQSTTRTATSSTALATP